jgi:neutral ceramidase
VPDANNTYVVIAGLANSYSHYIATWEEYRMTLFFFFFLFVILYPKHSIVPFQCFHHSSHLSHPLFTEQQRYEGASTLYGPNTLAAYQMYYYNLTSYLVNNLTPPHGPNPPNLTQTVLRPVRF